MKKLVINVDDLEKALWVKAVRLEKGRKLERWVRDALNDAATLELAQKTDEVYRQTKCEFCYELGEAGTVCHNCGGRGCHSSQ